MPNRSLTEWCVVLNESSTGLDGEVAVFANCAIAEQ